MILMSLDRFRLCFALSIVLIGLSLLWMYDHEVVFSTTMRPAVKFVLSPLAPSDVSSLHTNILSSKEKMDEYKAELEKQATSFKMPGEKLALSLLYPTMRSSETLLVLVESRPVSFVERMAIRLTWGNSSSTYWPLGMSNYSVIFSIGEHEDDAVNLAVQRESERFKDILRLDFPDSYVNLANKTVLSFRWIALYSNHDFVLKTDEDCSVNVWALTMWLKGASPETLYAGALNIGMPVIREPQSRYYVSLNEYPHEFYEPYCAGGGFVLGRNSLRKIAKQSYKVLTFRNEDAFVGHLAAGAGVKPTDDRRFLRHLYSKTPLDDINYCDWASSFVIHDMAGYKQIYMFDKLILMLRYPEFCLKFSSHQR